MTQLRIAAATAVFTGVLLAACASTDVAEPAVTSVTVDVPATTDAAGTTGSASAAIDDQVAWLVRVLDAGEFDATEASERFDPGFLVEVPVAALNAPLAQIAPPGSAPWRIVNDSIDGRVAEITVESAQGARLIINLAITASTPHLIEGLFLQPAEPEVPDDYTFAQLDADMAGLAAERAIGVYEVGLGGCDVVYEANGDQPLAIGSIFKLWVLAELADQIDQGTATWDEQLAVRAELRSDPAGQVYQLDDGDTLTLRQHAEAMISVSDNTATDHLIDRLGRQSVEAAMVRSGVAEPSLNQPFLATRELFWLKFLADPPNPPEWYDADVDGRRAILASLAGKTVPWYLDPTIATSSNAEGLSQDQPRNLDIEWLASTSDLCRTLDHLDEVASKPGLEPVADILSINPGVELDPDVWTHVRFKGGSEPGVLAMAWWLERNDGRMFVVVGILNDPDKGFSEIAAADLVNNAIDLIPT